MSSLLFTSLLYFVASNTNSKDAPQQWQIVVDDNATEPFYYYWDKCVGSGHAALMLRQDWRSYMHRGVKNIGFQYVRGHGILDDDVGSVNSVNEYSFINIDKIYQYLLSINMKPYVEISFMPSVFRSNDTFIDHYVANISPPKDYNVWFDFIQKWVQHLVDEFGIDEVSTWIFEVWNEPDTKHWSGYPKYDTYLQLYNATATAIKSVNKKLNIGGPTVHAPVIQWIESFLNDTISKQIPVDFVVFHSYPSKTHSLQSYIDGIQSALNIIDEYNVPAFISEYSSTCCAPFGGYDDNYSSSFLIYAAKYFQKLFPKQQHSTLQWMSYWSISDVFDERDFNSNEFNGLYGLQTIRGITKPSFRAMELLHNFGGNISFKAKLMTENVQNDSVIVYCLQNGHDRNRLSVFISNFKPQELPINAYDVIIYINNLKSKLSKVTMYRIDGENTNPFSIWQNMSSPMYPSDYELQQINDSSQLIPMHNVDYKVINESTTQINVHIPIYGVVLLDLQY